MVWTFLNKNVAIVAIIIWMSVSLLALLSNLSVKSVKSCLRAVFKVKMVCVCLWANFLIRSLMSCF
jgi:hypothetical protein